MHTNTPDKLILTFLFIHCVLLIYLLHIFVYASFSWGARFLPFCFLYYYLGTLYKHFIFSVFVYLNTLRVHAIAFLFKPLIRLSTSTPPSHHHFTTPMYHKSPSFLFDPICSCLSFLFFINFTFMHTLFTPHLSAFYNFLTFYLYLLTILINKC